MRHFSLKKKRIGFMGRNVIKYVKCGPSAACPKLKVSSED